MTAAPAIGVTLFAAAMWGSWMQIVKRCPQYPVCGLALALCTVTVILAGLLLYMAGIFMIAFFFCQKFP